MARNRGLEQEIAAVRSQVIADAVMIATTVTGTYTNDELSDRRFERLICDEASMVPVPAIFYACQFARKAVTVAGDFCQLAPITIEKKNALVIEWLQRSIFEAAKLDDPRRIDGDPRAQMLKKQYRMQPQIRQLIGDVFYRGELEDARDEDNSKCQEEPCPGAYAAIYETSSMNPWCSRTSSWSRFNLYHALACVELAQRATKSFPPNADDGQPSIGIVVPYRAQFHLTKALIEDKHLQSEVAVATVHRFQGAEKDVIIFDLVDSIGAKKVGRLLRGGKKSDGARLINVACSRAREKLAVIANLGYFHGRLDKDDALGKVLDRLLGMAPHFEAQTLLPSEAIVGLGRALDLVRPSVVAMDSVGPYSLWKETDFHKGFQADVIGARSSIIILSPFLASKRLGDYFDILSEKIRQGVEVVVATRPPERHAAGMRDQAEQGIHALEQIGANIQRRSWMHEKAAIIDNRVVWFGSLNILSHSKTEESMMRLCGENTARQFLRQLGITTGPDVGMRPKVKINVSKIPLKRCACGQRLQVVPKGKFGPFYKCSGCRATASIVESDLLDAIDPDQRACPECGKPVKLKRSNRGAFLGCSGFPDCKYTIDLTGFQS